MSLSAQQLQFFATYIEKELGIVYSEQNFYQLEKRLDEICKVLEFPGKEALWKKASAEGISGHFKQLLLDTATNNETSFFRDAKVFAMIEEHVFPEWRKRASATSTFRVWSAASSFGQEPYTLAILFNEMAAKHPGQQKIEILATDISEIALQKAKNAKYSQLEVQRGMPAPLLIKYFVKKDDDYWYLKPEIRAMVKYQKINLLDMMLVPGPFDMVLCRNVLIYQNDERKKAIIESIRRKMADNSYLILGAAESIIGLSQEFSQVIKDGAVYYQKK